MKLSWTQAIPGQYVVREWIVTSEGPQPGLVTVVDTLAEARLHIPPGAARLDPEDDDNLSIVESWV